ncbi:MAG: hypothetical protein K8M05_15795 [Deltaproteobacteria bacterium]|nr:hypothetical protein [Kofleriaceae bacterium]
MLPRMQLVEWNDLEATPAALRDIIVESLSRSLRWGRMMRGLVEPFQRFLATAGTDEILDLCSGAGGPAGVLAAELGVRGAAPRFLLTDLYPRPEAWSAVQREHPGVIDFVEEPVDATAIPADLAAGRARVVINAFHHFPPPLARAILADAVAGSRGIFISEALVRNPLSFLAFGPAGLAALYADPLLAKRDRLKKALLVWATPIALAAGTWDGLVSTMRIYEESELRDMVAPFGDRFRWTYGTYTHSLGGRGYYFYGVPR